MFVDTHNVYVETWFTSSVIRQFEPRLTIIHACIMSHLKLSVILSLLSSEPVHAKRYNLASHHFLGESHDESYGVLYKSSANIAYLPTNTKIFVPSTELDFTIKVNVQILKLANLTFMNIHYFQVHEYSLTPKILWKLLQISRN